MRVVWAVLLMLAAGAVGCKKKRPEAPVPAEPERVTPAEPRTSGGTRGVFTIGPRTTYVLGPVTTSGHIDYVAALNDRLSAGVPPAGNANVAIWSVLGPNPPDGTNLPPGFFARMGVEPPPAVGNYYVGLSAYAGQVAPAHTGAAVAALPGLSARPWKPAENAVISGWLKANAEPLTALRDAVTRPGYYNPLLPTEPGKGLFSALNSGLTAGRELAGALACRAMLSLGEGDAAEAWRDILTCSRLGRRVGHNGVLIEGLVGMAIEHVATRAAVAFLAHARLGAAALDGCRRDLAALPPRADMAAQIDFAERIFFLDGVMQLDRHGWAEAPAYGDDFQPIRHGLTDDLLAGIDWNPALEEANTHYDRIAAIFRTTDRAGRVRRLRELLDETRAPRELFAGGQSAAALKAAGSPAERGRLLGRMMLASAGSAFMRVSDAADRIRQATDNVAIAFALARYKLDHGRYPDTLAPLAPRYFKAVPGDVFSEKQPIYRPTATGFILYSVGPNGADDGGRTLDGQPPGDDIVVRVPPQP